MLKLWRRKDRGEEEVSAFVPVAEAPMLRGAFTPTRPQRGRGLIGRKAELRRVIEAIKDDQAHVVLYAQRGQGKTSLANRITELLRSDGYCVARYVCSAKSTFGAIVRGLARDIPDSFLTVPASPAPGVQGCEQILPDREIEPADVAGLPSRLNVQHLVFIVDEFDRVQIEATKDMMADTVKQVSDRAVSISFVILGVSSNLDHLLGRYPSIERNVVGVQVPPLSAADIEAIVARGSITSQLEFPPEVTAEIVKLSGGSPYLAHLLGLRLSQAARDRTSRSVNLADFDKAMNRISQEHDQVALESYSRAFSDRLKGRLTILLGSS